MKNKCLFKLSFLTLAFLTSSHLAAEPSISDIARAITDNAGSEKKNIEFAGGSTGLRTVDFDISYNSVEDWLSSIKNQQEVLTNQLTNINMRAKMLSAFLAKQKSLKLRWIDSSQLNAAHEKALEIDPGDGKRRKICHANFQKGTHPGIVREGGCLITYGGDSLVIPFYQVLTTPIQTEWMNINNEKMMEYQLYSVNPDSDFSKEKLFPIQGGFSDTPFFSKNTPLYICKAKQNGQFYIGKVVSYSCNIAVDSIEVSVPEFTVLGGVTKG